MDTLIQLAVAATAFLSGTVATPQPPTPIPPVGVHYIQKQVVLRSEAEKAKLEKTTSAMAVRSPQAAPSRAVSGSDVASRIKKCESGGRYDAVNKSGSSASGAYQYLDSSWAGYGGYARAKDAPPAVQDAKFQADLARSGTRPWNASRSCWG